MSADPLRDARLFPLELDAQRGEFLLLSVDADTIGRAAFLDRRLEVAREAAQPLPVAALDAWRDEPAPEPAFLFHTAFCCSTLLARALHAPPGAMALKEPSALLGLQNYAIAAGAAPARLMQLSVATLRLLARPWGAAGRVLIKPTNIVNGVLPELLVAAPRARAVLLYSSLREFLISCVKKLPDAETRIRWMAQHLLHRSALAKTLGVTPQHPFHFVESCVLTWYAQLERYADALAADSGDRLRTLDMDVLLAAPAEVVAACADWLELPAARRGLEARVAAEFSRHAKSTEVAYDPAERAREKERVLVRYGALIAQAEAWAAEVVAPLARLPAAWKPLAVAVA